MSVVQVMLVKSSWYGGVVTMIIQIQKLA